MKVLDKERCSYERHSHQLGERWVGPLTFKFGVLAFKLVGVNIEVRASTHFPPSW